MTEEERGGRENKSTKHAREFSGPSFAFCTLFKFLPTLVDFGWPSQKRHTKKYEPSLVTSRWTIMPKRVRSTLNSCTLLCTGLSLPKKQTSSVSKPVCGFCSLLLLQTSSRIHSSDDCQPSSGFQCKSISVSSFSTVAPKFKKSSFL